MGAFRRSRRDKYRRDGNVFLAESGFGAPFLDAAWPNFLGSGRGEGPSERADQLEQGRPEPPVWYVTRPDVPANLLYRLATKSGELSGLASELADAQVTT